MTPEWESFIRAQKGDNNACGALLEQHQPRLTALALFVTGSVEAANDVVQETFVRALDAKIKQTTGTVIGFLATIAYRLALKEAKQAKKNVPIDGFVLEDHRQNPLESVLANERDRLVIQVVGALNPDQRDVLVLRFYGGHSYEEIAEILRVPLGTVKSRVFYAVKTCREILRRKGALK